jgi:hypothetical protein
MWTTSYRGPAHGADTATDLAISPDGLSTFVTGTSVGAVTGRDVATVAYSMADGSQRWRTRHHPAGDDYAAALAVGPAGRRLYVTGTDHVGSNGDITTTVYDARTGGTILSSSFDSGGSDSAAAIAVTVGSRFVVTGSAGGDYVTIAYSSGAIPQWTRTYDGGHGFDGAVSVAFGHGQVYVTGTSDGGTIACDEVESTSFATVAYDATAGTTSWAERYAGLSRHPDNATAVVASPAGGTVFVTGTSDDGCHQSDVATLAYSA